MKAATVCAAIPDIVTGWGLVDSHNTMYLPQSVIDNEMAGMLRRLNRPVEVSEATLAGDGIATAGPGGGFLAQKDTARRIRAGEHYLPTLSNRLSYEKWAEQGTSELDDACERVEALLGAHVLKEPYVDGAQLDTLAEICRVDDEAVRRARRA
jgi:trimethylamine--corrinoid protein Co-methyltransferase